MLLEGLCLCFSFIPSIPYFFFLYLSALLLLFVYRINADCLTKWPPAMICKFLHKLSHVQIPSQGVTPNYYLVKNAEKNCLLHLNTGKKIYEFKSPTLEQHWLSFCLTTHWHAHHIITFTCIMILHPPLWDSFLPCRWVGTREGEVQSHLWRAWPDVCRNVRLLSSLATPQDLLRLWTFHL